MGATVLQFKARGDGMDVEDLTLAEIDKTYRRRKRDLRYALSQLEEQHTYLVKRYRGEEKELASELEPYLLGLAPATRKAYGSELRKADAYFDGNPIDDDSLPEYLLWRHREMGLAPATILVGIRALTWRAKKLGEPVPFGEKSKSVLQFIQREGVGRGRGKVTALLREDLEKMVDCCEAENTLLSRRDAAVLSVMFDAALRISEASAIQVEHVAIGSDGKFRLFIPSSKTDQTGNGVHIRISHSTFSMVEAWKRHSRIIDGALFRPVRAEGIGPGALTADAIRNTIKRRAKQAGIDSRVSGHSLRRGCAQSMTLQGMASHKIALHCRWKSTAMLVSYSDGVDVLDSAIGELYNED